MRLLALRWLLEHTGIGRAILFREWNRGYDTGVRLAEPHHEFVARMRRAS